MTKDNTNPRVSATHPQGDALTTAQGLPLKNTDKSLKAGPRGPVLLQDHHLREKITHFDHERIPERAVHARGAGAHGTFFSYGTAEKICQAAFLRKGVETQVFVRFSTVAGSLGSADTVRDTRGFATKFYTTEGNYDLVGNNIPVFFIQDGIKFPDVVHAVKPEPDLEIPQAQSAHDTFWDFVSLHTEAQAHALWNMSDRGIPRSYRTMEGFGVHTFRLTNKDGDTTLVKFHWKPKLGVHSLTWDEALLTNGQDPDFHRRDLAEAIKAGAFPEWELGVQVFPDTEEEMFEGIDLLDPTKFVPEELAPVQPVGKMVLHHNPSNYFAETEQVAFHPGHLVPGIDVTNDPLLQVRLFSYIDTQLTRLGGPNFSQIPINQPIAPVNDMQRDGFHQQYVHGGKAPYSPNSLDGGCPFMAGGGQPDAKGALPEEREEILEAPQNIANTQAFIDVPQKIRDVLTERAEPATFEDHFSQARMFYRSLTHTEQLHVQQAYSFELGKCTNLTVRRRQLQALANIDLDLCATVADGLGLPVPTPTVEVPDRTLSPTVAQIGQQWPTDGRVLGVVVDDATDADAITAVVSGATANGLTVKTIAPHGGVLPNGQQADRSFLTARSIEFDAVVLLAQPIPAPDAIPDLDHKAALPEPGTYLTDPRIVLLLQETYRQGKAILLAGIDPDVLTQAGISEGSAGVVNTAVSTAVDDALDLLSHHRAWDRFKPEPTTH